jgi:aquaporin Z
MQSFVLEVILSGILMFVILNVSQGAKEKGITAGIVVGAVIALEALFAGPICGASMNPARSLAPAIVSGHLEHLWIYLLAPVLGMLVAIPLFQAARGFLQGSERCHGAAFVEGGFRQVPSRLEIRCRASDDQGGGGVDLDGLTAWAAI